MSSTNSEPGPGAPSRRRVFALVDCNNFYASCERVFEPRLEGRPIVVLSNNDGCIVARSQESKTLGVPMGAPIHQVRGLLKRHDVAVYSSNYTLYGDMSARVMAILGGFAPHLEIYSIDEAFLGLDGNPRLDLDAYGRRIATTVRQWTGIPVSVGIGPTKTLAKIANRTAKRSAKAGGVLSLLHPANQDILLERTEVQDVWGVGRRWGKRLRRAGIVTARDLRDADTRWIRSRFNVVAERIVLELRGISCLDLEDMAPARRQIMCTRSLGERVEDLPSLQSAVSHHVTRAAEKLRGQGSAARAVMVFIQTSPFADREPRYSNAVTMPLPQATQNTGELLHHALRGLRSIYRRGYRYQKTGIMLLDLQEERATPPTLFGDGREPARSRLLMRAMDGLNRRLGRGSVRYAAEGFEGGPWVMKSRHRSPAYTTRWSDLPVVQA